MAANDSEQDRWEHATRLGIKWPDLRNLQEMMAFDYRVDSWGFPQLLDMSDVRLRALASDQIISAADAVLTNLIEARTAETDFQDRNAAGLPMDDEIRDDVAQDITVIGFFRAFGSTLDCLAGVLIGALRLPVPIYAASMARDLIRDLDPTNAAEPDQANLFAEYRALLDRHRAGPPRDWLDWALSYRNALLHRPRQINMHLQRETNTALWVPRHVARGRVRFDLYLRSRPWLPELQHLAEPDAHVTDLFLHEPATRTLRGLMVNLNELVEDTARWLREPWIKLKEGKLTLPSQVQRWGPAPEPPIQFEGFAPGKPPPNDAMLTHPRTAVRFALAQKLLNVKKQ